MPAKHKVTLYLSDDLHRQFKIRSAIDGETMSSMAQRAIEFYLGNVDVVENGCEIHGQTHRIHACPKCASPVALREDGLALVQTHSEQVFGELDGLQRITELAPEPLGARSINRSSNNSSKAPDEGELIIC
ncbi:MAG: hypothetical protein HC800_03925 [Phormidesmis sp. RL_2_1]|nr:hypothetical protein [Phormidesmis sp. RL_2_1]